MNNKNPVEKEVLHSADLPVGAKSLEMVRPKKWGPRVAWVSMFFLVTIGLILAFVPWQQTVTGTGSVVVYDAMARPQSISAQIPARFASWSVQEGDYVEAGQVIAKLEDIDSKFLDAGQSARVEAQLQALLDGKSAAQQRVVQLSEQQRELMTSRQNAISGAKQRREQATKRLNQATEDLKGAIKTLEIGRDVAVQNATERLEQAKQRVDQANERINYAKVELETARINRDRMIGLEIDGARSKRDVELSIQVYTKAETDLEVARKQLAIAQRDVLVGGLDQKRIDLEVERENTRVARARDAVKIAQDDIYNASFEVNRIIADTAATLNSVGGSIQSAVESVAKNRSDIVKVDIDQQNLKQRVDQQIVKAPRAGRIVRLMKVGAGETVKSGDELAVLMPDSKDQHVELYISDNDIPLISPGRHVRLQFAGWPAVQVGGFPSVQFGTFGGRVLTIDAVDDGTQRFRVIVEPEQQRLVNNKVDPKWPDTGVLRPGAAVEGWIMLDTVSLGFELWRQFNALPPRLSKAPKRWGKDGKGKEQEGEKKDKYMNPGANTIKVKTGKS